MTKLRNEFQKIVDRVNFERTCSPRVWVKELSEVALRIQEYIDAKEPVMLTEKELATIWINSGYIGTANYTFAGLVQTSFFAKQKQPQKRKVTVRIYVSPEGRIFPVSDDERGTVIDHSRWTLKHTYEAEFDV